MTSYYKVRHFVLDESSFAMLNTETNQHRRIGTHDFQVLFELCKNAGSVVAKEQLLEHAWPGKFVADSSITQAISNVRTLIGDNGKEQKWLKTISKVGYKLEESIVTIILNGDLESKSDIDAIVAKNAPPEKLTSQTTSIESNGIARKIILKYKKITKPILLISLLGVTSFFIVYQYFYKNNYENRSDFPPVVYKTNNAVIYSLVSDLPSSLKEKVEDTIENKNTKFIAIMIKGKNLSVSIVRDDGSIYNKLVTVTLEKTSNEASDIVSEEIDNAFN